MDETTQALLFQQARMGDQSAIHELYTDTRDEAYFAARRYIGGETDVTGILKDTYIITFGRLGEVPPGKGFTAWLHYVLAIQCLNYLRGRRMALDVKEEFTGFPAEGELFPASWVEEEPRRGEVLRVIDGLPDGQRLAVTLHYLGGLSVAEIAQCMGVREAAANTHLQMGKNALRAGSPEAAAPDSGQPVLIRLFRAEAAAAQMPPEVAKDVYQEMMLFFMDGKKAPKLVSAAAPSSGGGGKGKGFLPWLIMFVLVALAIVFLFWNFQRQQKAIGQQKVAEYEMNKAEEDQYQSAASEAEPPPPPQTESATEDPAGEESTENPAGEESAAPDEGVPPVESQADGESSGGEIVQIID